MLAPCFQARANSNHNLFHVDAPLWIKRLAQRNAIIKTLCKRVVVDARNTRPFHESVRNAIKRKVTARATVVLLFGSSRPATVFWTVWAIIINALKRHPLGTLAHVGNEICRRIKPAFADGNTARTIMPKSSIVRVCAALLHRKPTAVSAASAASIMAKIGPHIVSAKTSAPCRFTAAGNDPSLAQMIAANGFDRAALAFANPVTGFGGISFFDGVKAKFLAAHFNKFSHSQSVPYSGIGVKR